MTTPPVPTKSKSKDRLPGNIQPIFNPVITKKLEDVAETTATTELVTNVPVPRQRDCLRLKIARRMAAFHSCLAGTPKTERERTRRSISEWERQCKYELIRYF